MVLTDRMSPGTGVPTTDPADGMQAWTRAPWNLNEREKPYGRLLCTLAMQCKLVFRPYLDHKTQNVKFINRLHGVLNIVEK